MRLTKLLGSPIEDPSGQPLGHVVDIRFSGEELRTVESTFFLYGTKSVLERLGVPRMERKLPQDNIREITRGKVKMKD